jgi:hypothetical protein
VEEAILLGEPISQVHHLFFSKKINVWMFDPTINTEFYHNMTMEKY